MQARRAAFILTIIVAVVGCAAAVRTVTVYESPELARTPTPTTTPAPDVTKPTSAMVTPVPVPNAPPPLAPAANDLDSPLVRVLLERSAGVVRLPQPGRAYLAICADQTRWLWGPLSVTAEGGRAWQVGAFSELASAESATQALRAVIGPQDTVQLKGGGDALTRVVVRFSIEPAVGGAERLAQLGHPGAFSVAAGGVVTLEGNGGPKLQCTGEVRLEPAGNWPTVVGSRPYRGRFLVRVHNGRPQVVNQLGLEAYLKGVVPVEMGPARFPELEALKAQAVAARTYAVAHFGDHEAEGWDLCATPACQAYHGVEAEHSLSDRAVDETSGLFAVFDGVPINAMYTSTCGGHTENVESLFSGGPRPYLRGVACAWERELKLTGTSQGTPETVDGRGLNERVAAVALGVKRTGSSTEIVAAVARLCGGSSSPLTGSGSDEVARALLQAGGLRAAGLELARQPGLNSRALLAVADLFSVDLDPPVGPSSKGWNLRAALAVLEIQGVVVRERGELVPHPAGVGIFPKRADHSEPVIQPVPLYEGWGDGFTSLVSATARPGTTLERISLGDRVLALTIVRSGGGDEADRRSAWRSWVREKSWSELAAGLGVPDLSGLDITSRTASGRVVGLRARGRSGKVKEWTGFSVRGALDLPENLFSLHRRTMPDGSTMVRFLGRGWGHGVGLCQNGSYGLARSGMTFDRILATYYQGVELEAIAPE